MAGGFHLQAVWSAKNGFTFPTHSRHNSPPGSGGTEGKRRRYADRMHGGGWKYRVGNTGNAGS